MNAIVYYLMNSDPFSRSTGIKCLFNLPIIAMSIGHNNNGASIYYIITSKSLGLN